MKRVALLSLILLFAMAGAAMAGDKAIDQGKGYMGAATGLALVNPFAAAANWGGLNSLYGGYFVIDGLEIGGILTLDYNSNSTTTTDENDDETTVDTSSYLFGIGAQLAYFFKGRSIWSPYLALALEYGMYNQETETEPPQGDTTTITNEGSGFVIFPRAGFAFFLTPNFALDTSLYATYAILSGTNTDDTSGDEVETDGDMNNMDVGFMMGLNFFF